MSRAAALLLVLLPLPALAQGAATPPPAASGIPETLRGAWVAGESCARPEALLFLTARSAATLPADGAPVLLRFAAVAAAPGGWTLGTATGPQAPRLALRSPGEGRLETAEPAAKTRDDRLPGEGVAPRAWRRCPQIPAPLAARHGEGLAALVALEHLEASCGPDGAAGACLAAVVAVGDVTRDGALSVAELARLARGAAWLLAVREGRAAEAGLASSSGATAMTAARRLVEGLDYDGDGKLSPAELSQDRAGDAAGAALGQPLAGLEGLHGLLQGPGPNR